MTQAESGVDISAGSVFDPPEEGPPSLAETASREETVPIGVPVSEEEFEKLKREAHQSGISTEEHPPLQEEDPPEDLLFNIKEKQNAK